MSAYFIMMLLGSAGDVQCEVYDFQDGYQHRKDCTEDYSFFCLKNGKYLSVSLY